MKQYYCHILDEAKKGQIPIKRGLRHMKGAGHLPPWALGNFSFPYQTTSINQNALLPFSSLDLFVCSPFLLFHGQLFYLLFLPSETPKKGWFFL